MKKVVSMALGTLMAFSMLAGCDSETAAPSTPANTAGKVVVNIEGTVSAINENEITLDSGKVIVITENTVFAGDPDTGVQVSNDIAEGNFIQAYTSDELSADKVTVNKVYCNTMPQRTAGKMLINFEGTVVSVVENSYILDNGQTVVFDDITAFTNVNGTISNAEIEVGDYIQGYTDGEPTASEITAKRIHIVTF